MIDFIINQDEMGILYGLPHVQQLIYLRGIKPYMDVKTGMVGINRGISYQSLAEQLYIEPHQGIKSQSFSRAQVRRALANLERVGLIKIQSQEFKLILKCNLATKDYFIQNKVVTKPSHQEVTVKSSKDLEGNGFSKAKFIKAELSKTQKADTPQYNNYYIFLFKQFEKFWELYPVKKSQQQAWKIFQELDPSNMLIEKILSALQAQIDFIQQQQAQGFWVPNWKNPANWLAQQCWTDELTTHKQDINHATHEKNCTRPTAYDPLWSACQEGDSSAYTDAEDEPGNIIQFPKCANESETY